MACALDQFCKCPFLYPQSKWNDTYGIELLFHMQKKSDHYKVKVKKLWKLSILNDVTSKTIVNDRKIKE